MTPQESEILDELYFVISFSDFKNQLSFGEEELINNLKSLLLNEYVWQMKFVKEINDFDRNDQTDFENISGYHYLATKKGLFAHHTSAT